MAREKPRHNANKTLEASIDRTAGDAEQTAHDLVDYVKEYARENPGTVALWCLAIGFVLGWKMKPW